MKVATRLKRVCGQKMEALIKGFRAFSKSLISKILNDLQFPVLKMRKRRYENFIPNYPHVLLSIISPLVMIPIPK